MVHKVIHRAGGLEVKAPDLGVKLIVIHRAGGLEDDLSQASFNLSVIHRAGGLEVLTLLFN